MTEETTPPALTTSAAPLAPLKRILAKKEIPRAIGVPIAPGQAVYLPEAEAEAAIKDGLAVDPDAKAEPKAKEKA